jgi:hypothetical protein
MKSMPPLMLMPYWPAGRRILANCEVSSETQAALVRRRSPHPMPRGRSLVGSSSLLWRARKYWDRRSGLMGSGMLPDLINWSTWRKVSK